MSLSLRQIRYFVATAEAGQVSRAAIDLAVSQSAVTAAIKQLEEQVGGRLFERHAQGVSLTLEGSRFLRHARSIVATVDEALRVQWGAAEKTSGIVRVGVTYTVAGYFLPAHQARFMRGHPGVTLQLREADRATIEADLVKGGLDIAVLLTSNVENRRDIVSETLIRSRRRLWMPIDHRLQHVPEVHLADIAAEPYVMLTVDEASQTAGRYWARSGLEPQVIFRTSSVEAVRSMVAAGMGVTILSDMVYRPWSLEGQRIETRAVADPIPSMDVGLAWRRGAEFSPAGRAFHDFMSLTFNGSGHGLAG